MPNAVIVPDKCKPDPEEQAVFSRLDFTMVGPDIRIRCSLCHTDYELTFTEGIGLNMAECGHHPDWYYLHALRFPNGLVLVWECCKEIILSLDRRQKMPRQLILPPTKLSLTYDELVQQRFSQPTPLWLKAMDEEFFFAIGDDHFNHRNPRRFSRHKDC